MLHDVQKYPGGDGRGLAFDGTDVMSWGGPVVVIDAWNGAGKSFRLLKLGLLEGDWLEGIWLLNTKLFEYAASKSPSEGSEKVDSRVIPVLVVILVLVEAKDDLASEPDSIDDLGNCCGADRG